jgi:aspartyl-tRNA(Asn)/glutamyl-tRNA(Gln) amidotransferase subunit C
MSKKITRETVKQVADLIKLAIPEDELDLYSSNLNSAIEAIDTLSELDTDSVPETAQTIGTENIMRDDNQSEGLTQEEALLNSKGSYKGYFQINKVFHDEEE